MSSERSQKIFDATPARRQKAKREGNVARSNEVSGIAAFACAALAMFATLPWLGESVTAALVATSRRPDLARLPSVVFALPAIALIPAGAAAAGSIAVNLWQAGGLTVSPPKLQLNRLNPVSGLKRMVAGEAIVGAIRALAAFTVAAFALWPMVSELVTQATALSDAGAFGVLVLAGAQRACAATLGVGACFAIADYALARRRWLRDLKMTREEIRRDQKENDGDPHARSRRKSLHRTLVQGSIARTKDASFVLVNPTHIAIAVRYAPPEVAVPEILVRAADEAAQSVKAIATARGIPIIENVALARALYAHGEAGRAIPTDTFVAVARIIAELVRAGAMT